MQKLRLGLYGALTAAGIGWPWYCIYKFVKETEVLGLTDPIEIVNLFSAGVWANASAGFIAADLTVVLIASFVFYAAEGMRIGMKRWYLYIPFTFLISLLQFKYTINYNFLTSCRTLSRTRCRRRANTSSNELKR